MKNSGDLAEYGITFHGADFFDCHSLPTLILVIFGTSIGTSNLLI
jgi:hypothetical protein